MKRIANLLLFTLLASVTMAQQKPDYVQTRTNQVLSNFSLRARQALIIPSGTTPGFPSYVADTSKCGALFNKTGGAKDTLMRYDCATGKWLAQTNDADVVHKAGDEVNLGGDKTWTGLHTWRNGGSSTSISSHGLTSIESSPINPFWTTNSQLFISRHTGLNIAFQSGSPIGGGAGFYLIDSTRGSNAKVFGIQNTYGTFKITSVNDNGNPIDSLLWINRSGDSFFKGNIFQNGNQVANDNTVVHLAGTETITGDKTHSGSTFFTPTVTGSSGTNTPPFEYSPTVSQSGTAFYSLYRISPYIQSLGGNEGGSRILDIGYRSAAFPSGTYTSVFSFQRNGTFSASGAVAVGNSAVLTNLVQTPRYITTGGMAQGVGTVPDEGMLLDFKAATMGTNAYSGMTTVTVPNAQAGYIGIPTFQLGSGVNNSTVTVTDASTLMIAGAPIGESAYNIYTNKWAFRVASGNTYFGGNVRGLLPPTNPLDLVNKRSLDSLANYVDIRNFGAIADYDPITDTYTTDNTSAIQAAINSLPNGAGTIYIPNGKGRGFAFTGTIYRGQGTRFLGDNSGFSIQKNATDTINYKVASLLRYKGTGTALALQTTANYRNQFLYDENFAIIGNGKTSANIGIQYNSNPSYVTTNPNSKDVGLVNVNHVFVDGFKTGIDFSRSDTYYLEDSHINNTQVAIRGGKQDGYIFNNCFFANDSTMYNHAGLALDIHDNEVEPSSTIGIGFVGDSLNYSTFHDNKYKNIKTAIILKNKGGANSIHNETVLTPTAESFIISGLDDNNSVFNNTVVFSNTRILYARQTNKLFVQGNTWAHPINSSVPAAQMDTCANLTYVNNYDADFGNNFKLSTTGTSGADASDFNTRRVWGTGNYNGTPSFSTRYSAGSFQSPTAVGSGVVFGTYKGEAYNGSSFAQTANIEFQTTESQSGSAGGSRINLNVTPTSSTTRSLRAYVDGNGLTVFGQHTVNQTSSLATTLNAANRITNINAQSGTGSSMVQRGDWLVRNTAAGSTWTTTTWFDGFSVDGSFVTPYTDTKTWYARNINGGVHSWGTGSTTFASLSSTGLNLPSLTASQFVATDASKNLVSVQLYATNATTSALSSATLSSTYPSAAAGFRVICESITAGPVIYTKGASGWLSVPATVVP